ncbi:MAG: adaptor protein MecA [Eubacteriales bacterium]
MKIEKVNEQQIRCTLTKADLANRDLKISELAYGSEKAKNLFRDMMQQAALKFGFEAEDIPLMIEAIPLNGDCIVLIITKVEDPEELDTRFSKFAPSIHDEDEEAPWEQMNLEDDDVLDLFRKIQKQDTSSTSLPNMEEISVADDAENNSALTFNKIFSFHSLYEVTHVSKLLAPIYEGNNSLYKNKKNQRYYLILSFASQPTNLFKKVYNLLSEHACPEKYIPASHAFLEEHQELILSNHAIQSLSQM